MATVKRKPAAPQAYRGPVFAAGETVLVQRPNLWSGAVGEVIKVDNGIHRIRIEAKPGGSTFSAFHADVSGDQLESYL